MDTTMGKSSKKKKVLVIVLAVTAVIMILAAAVFLAMEQYYKSHFLKGTKLNGIDVSKMTVEQLNQCVEEYQLRIEERTKDGDVQEETLLGKDISLKINESEEFQKILSGQQGGVWLFEKGKEYELEVLTEYDEKLWEQQFSKLQCLSEDFIMQPINAYVAEYDKQKGSFELVAEVEGNQLNETKTEETLLDAVKKLKTKVSLEEKDCYIEPERRAEDSDVTAFHQKLNQYAGVHITYAFGDVTEELTGDDIVERLVIDFENLQVSLDMERIRNYVNYLARYHDTIFTNRTFMTSYGQEVLVESGDYGWWMDRSAETEALAEMIETGKSGERKPIYRQEAAQYGDKDYGNTYVEINLTAQHLFVYVDGELKLETDFVSGKPGAHATPTGTYSVTYTQKHAVLRGENYETSVSYWMPFNEDIGIHDATWQPAFGGNLYQQGYGSHGCVNVPYDMAKQIYGYISKGMPVICYHLPGTESATVTEVTLEQRAQGVIDAINEIADAQNKSSLIKKVRELYNDLKSAAKPFVTNYADLVAYEAQYR